MFPVGVGGGRVYKKNAYLSVWDLRYAKSMPLVYGINYAMHTPCQINYNYVIKKGFNLANITDYNYVINKWHEI